MTKEMGAQRPVIPEKISEYGLTEEAQACLGEQLTALLLGEAWIAIENHLKAPSLERWRILSGACDPRGAYSELTDTRAVTNPPRAKSPKHLLEAISTWEGIQLRHQMATGIPILTETSKKYSLLNLLPAHIEKIVEDHAYGKTYDELKAYILDNVGRWEKVMGHSSGIH